MTPKNELIIKQNKRSSRAIAYWLFFCCFTIFCMIIVGAITRLSGSGLSMVEWRPLIGIIPPLNDIEWKRVFDLYQQSPEYQKKNYWMDINDFKQIFFWEWFHRALGRMIGVIYAIPLLIFFTKGWIPQTHKLKFLGLFLLGGTQGLMGWYMVKSGLVDMPAVSHYRLAAHLSLAILIYGLLLWLGLRFWYGNYTENIKAITLITRFAKYALAVLCITMLWGAYTAGLDAGLVYNDTFPHMGKSLIPEEIWGHRGILVNIVENHASVQFVHRWLAILTMITLLSFTIYSMKHGKTNLCYGLIGCLVFVQFGLGIITLFSGVSLPFAVMHQAGAVSLFTLMVIALHDTMYRPKNT